MACALMRLVYTSTHGGINERELANLSKEAKKLHADHGISGVIVVGDEDFLVVIESEPLIVTRALTHIVKDDRHDNLTVLLANFASDRLYLDWKAIKIARVMSLEIRRPEFLSTADFNPRGMTLDQIENMVHDLSKVA